MTSLNIVAHPDDDLLFLNSDIAEEIERGDRVNIVYLTVGDDGNNSAYVKHRLNAVHSAYCTLANLEPVWTYEELGHDVIAYNLMGSEIFVFTIEVKSNCFRRGDIEGSLYTMWHNREIYVERFESLSWYSGRALVVMLQDIIRNQAPDIIRTHNPNVEPALTHDEPHLDHVDHIYTAKFVQEAAKQFPSIPVYAYTGYPIRYQPPNLTEHQTMLKTIMWRAYQSVDTSVSGNIWDVALDKCYKERIQ